MDQDTYDADSASQAGESGQRPLWRRLFFPGRAELITDARRSPAENRHSRERWYKILQISRVPFLFMFVLSYIWWENWWISGVLFLISVPMPWIAVVVANAQGEPRDPRTAHVYKPAAAREAENQRQLALHRQVELEAAARGREPEIIDDSGAEWDGTDHHDTPPPGENRP